MNSNKLSTYERALGTMTGLAIGDALGMPTQSMSSQQIHKYYKGPITSLVKAVPEQPIAPNMKAGSVTDDTEQAFLLAERLINDYGSLNNTAYAKDLLQWEQQMREKGSFDLLGPSTKSALESLLHGVSIEETGKFGTTNGGAMRAAPIGISYMPGDNLSKTAWQSCVITHNTIQGIEATTLVASAVSFAIEGESNFLQRAVKYVSELPKRGHWNAKASVITRVLHFMQYAEESIQKNENDDSFAHTLQNACGTSVEANESVAAAFAIATRFYNSPTDALCFAASLGGDTDTIAAICGAMLGAWHGQNGFKEDIRDQVLNGLIEDHNYNIEQTVKSLCDLRISTSSNRKNA